MGDGHDHEGELFPRSEIAGLVGAAERARVRRERWQGWVLGLGLGAVALGLPGERLWGDMAHVWGTVEGAGPTARPLSYGASLLSRGFGLTAERAWFLLAAGFWAATVPALLGLLRSIGFARGFALPAALGAVLSPLGGVGATHPLEVAPGLFGATVLLWSLFAAGGPGPRTVRVVLAYALAVGLAPENLLLAPAVVWVLLATPGGRVQSIAVAAATVAFVAAFVAPETLAAGLSSDATGRAQWLVYFPAALGTGLLGLAALFFARREPEESPPPGWILAWAAAALAPMAGGTPAFGPACAYLLPLGAVGLADWASRRQREEVGRAWALGVLAAQIVLAVGVGIAWRETDPLREWRAMARAELEETDVVVSALGPRAYIVHLRWNLAGAEELSDEAVLAEVEAGGRRLVYLPTDSGPGEELGQRLVVPVEAPRTFILGSDGLAEQ